MVEISVDWGGETQFMVSVAQNWPNQTLSMGIMPGLRNNKHGRQGRLRAVCGQEMASRSQQLGVGCVEGIREVDGSRLVDLSTSKTCAICCTHSLQQTMHLIARGQ